MEMKSILKFLLLSLLVLPFQACSDDDNVGLPGDLKPMEVTPNNISGTWKLQSWSGSEEYVPVVYVELIRKDRKFNMYQCINSMYPEFITGVYSLENDYYKGDILKGKYDYDSGSWNNDYVVTLYKNRMVWVTDNGSGEVQEFVRVNEVPADIKDAALSPVEAR